MRTLLGGAFALLAMLVNVTLLRQSMPTAVKALSVVGVLIATFLLWLVFAAAITLAVR